VPGVLGAIAWVFLLSPKIGLVNRWAMETFGLAQPLINLYTFPGMIVTQAFHGYPIVFLAMTAALKSMDTSLEEASLMSGASHWTSFRRVTLRLMRPAILSIMLIMFIRGIELFEVPAIVGLPAGIEVFTTKIYLAIREIPASYGKASTMAVILVLISLAGAALYRRATARAERFATVTGKGYRPAVIDLGRWKYLHMALCLLFFAVVVVLPLAVLVWSSLLPFYRPPSAEALRQLTLKNYGFVLSLPAAGRAIQNSLLLALGTPTIVMSLAAVLAWITVKSRLPGRALVDQLTFLPVAYPGIVVGISLIWVYLVLPLPFSIYGTVWILLVAYITKFIPWGQRFTSAVMIQIHREIEEASETSGATWGQTFRRILLPLIMPGFVAGWIFLAIISLRELSTSILLYAHGSEVVSILVFDLWESGQYPHVAALGVLVVAVLLVLAVIAYRVGGRLAVIN
ncbi:MAG: iron ABC transporter permease, partial [Deltaproteobacteria bacterium]|nr:iron ABC transporter permease [Deltaproteobacteria bacterium]